MKNLKKWITSPGATLVLFGLAAGLLLFSTIGSAWAALQIFSQIYKGHVEMYDIGVTLMEKSALDTEARAVGSRDYKKNTQDEWDTTTGVLLGDGHFLAEGEDFIPGKTYQEEISCANTGTIDEYVRITLYKYWINPEGEKVFTSENGGVTTQGLAPELIKFTFPNLDTAWLLDTENSAETEERQIYYYNKLLKAGTDTTEVPLTDTLTIDPSVARKVTKITSDDGKTITTKYNYDGWQFCIEATVDAVQDHNAEDAIKSAWGRDVTISNGTLQLD